MAIEVSQHQPHPAKATTKGRPCAKMQTSTASWPPGGKGSWAAGPSNGPWKPPGPSNLGGPSKAGPSGALYCFGGGSRAPGSCCTVKSQAYWTPRGMHTVHVSCLLFVSVGGESGGKSRSRCANTPPWRRAGRDSGEGLRDAFLGGLCRPSSRARPLSRSSHDDRGAVTRPRGDHRSPESITCVFRPSSDVLS